MVKSKFCVIYITIIFAKEKKNPSRKKRAKVGSLELVSSTMRGRAWQYQCSLETDPAESRKT